MAIFISKERRERDAGRPLRKVGFSTSSLKRVEVEGTIRRGEDSATLQCSEEKEEEEDDDE